MTSLRACVLALVLACGTACPASAQPGPPGDADGYGADYTADAAPDDYEQSLAPYGAWNDAPSYGRVWAPAVAPGWQPYVDGYWAWSPYGWTWISYEPWGWTFHYGRWAYLPTGWVWVPGHVWGPAWVDWYFGDGFVGWAPLGPYGSHVTVINNFVFVPDRDFCSHRIRYFAHDWRSVPRDVSHHWGRRDFRPPPRDRIEHIAREPVHRFDGRPPGTLAPRTIDPRPTHAGPRVLERPGRRGPDDARVRRPNAGTPWQRRADVPAANPGPRVDVPHRLGSPVAPSAGWQRGGAGRPVREPGGFVTPPPSRAARQPVVPGPHFYRPPGLVGAAPTGQTTFAPGRNVGRLGGGVGSRGAEGGGNANGGGGHGFAGGARGGLGGAGAGMAIGR